MLVDVVFPFESLLGDSFSILVNKFLATVWVNELLVDDAVSGFWFVELSKDDGDPGEDMVDADGDDDEPVEEGLASLPVATMSVDALLANIGFDDVFDAFAVLLPISTSVKSLPLPVPFNGWGIVSYFYFLFARY